MSERLVIAIEKEPIELDKFLKLAGAVMTGGEVKRLVDAGLIKLNGKNETARRRKLYRGDIIVIAAEGEFEVG